MLVRPAAAADAAAVAELIREVYTPFATRFRPTALKWSAEAVGADPGAWLLAFAGTGLLGVVRQGPDPEGYTLDSLAVRPPVRRERVGSALASEVELLAREFGASQLIIALRDGLEVNRAFFTAQGYTRSRPHPPHHHVFTKQIGPRR